jgi:hypothetical protein
LLSRYDLNVRASRPVNVPFSTQHLLESLDIRLSRRIIPTVFCHTSDLTIVQYVIGIADSEYTAVCTDGSFAQDLTGFVLKTKAFRSLNSIYTVERPVPNSAFHSATASMMLPLLLKVPREVPMSSSQAIRSFWRFRVPFLEAEDTWPHSCAIE